MNPAWLPDRQLPTAMTLGHADEVADRLNDLLFDYVAAEPLGLENVFDENLCRVTVTSVAPLPPAIARLSADVLTQLRAAIEHATYAEVEAGLGRRLTTDEESRIEMLAKVTSVGFDVWLKQKKRKDLAPLREGAELVTRMRRLHVRRRPASPQTITRQFVRLTGRHRGPPREDVEHVFYPDSVSTIPELAAKDWRFRPPRHCFVRFGSTQCPAILLEWRPKRDRGGVSKWEGLVIYASYTPATGQWDVRQGWLHGDLIERTG